VEENLALGHEPVRGGLIQWKAVREKALEATRLVGLDIDPGRAIKELGIGQQQLVEIGKALAKKARILVLDEPTAALTETDAARLMRLLLELKAGGVSCIYISHRLEEVFQVADRVTVLRDGRSVGGGLRADLDTEKVIAMMVGREVGTLYPRPPHRPGVPLLKVQDWSVEDPLVPGRQVLRNVSLEVREREIVGIGGLMGAGRTALVSSLFGAARSRVTGTLSLGGGAPRKPFGSPPEAIAAGLALVSEDRKRYGLVIEASVSENLTLASLRRYVKGPIVDDKVRGETAREEAGALNIRASALGSAVRQLSGGNQQKVVLGKWLLTRPRVLFLDEPTRGVDVGAKAEIHRLIAELAEGGLGVVLVSSDLPELLGMSHRVLVLSLGVATAELSASEATPEAVMTAATVKV
jgi:D-xylose transport system ATP-binding protein